jgi:hypothetical protein
MRWRCCSTRQACRAAITQGRLLSQSVVIARSERVRSGRRGDNSATKQSQTGPLPTLPRKRGRVISCPSLARAKVALGEAYLAFPPPLAGRVWEGVLGLFASLAMTMCETHASARVRLLRKASVEMIMKLIMLTPTPAAKAGA